MSASESSGAEPLDGAPSPQEFFSAHPGQALAAELHRLDAARRTAERHVQLTIAERRLLWLLSDGHRRTFREISQDLGLEQSTVNRQVNGAAADGLVELIDAKPARQVTATPDGARAFTRAIGHVLDGYDEALARMGPGSRADFLPLLRDFIGHYGAVVSGGEAAAGG